MGAPQSRNEAILQATLDGTAYTDPPQSRIESLLLQLKAAIETGGGGGDTTVLAAKVAAIEAQLYSTIADVPTNTDTGSMDLNSADLNTITTSGFYNAITCTNAPANYCTLVVIGYYLAGYCAQIAVDVTTGKLHTRTQTNGTWGAWETKPSTTDLAAVATSGAYSDLSGKPELATVATTGAYNDLNGTPNLATVATSGRYADLTGKPTVDGAISSSSTNAVQNKAVSAALADKANSSALTAETTARENADTALQAAIGATANAGAKNILAIQNYAVGQTYTAHGRTFEVLADGGIKITGTTPDQAYADFYIAGAWANQSTIFDLHDATYTISLQSDIDLQTPYIYARSMDRRNGTSAETATASLATPTKDFSMYVTVVLITVRPEAAIPEDGIIIYPMIRRSEIADNTFVPYAPTNRELYEMILALQNTEATANTTEVKQNEQSE